MRAMFEAADFALIVLLFIWKLSLDRIVDYQTYKTIVNGRQIAFCFVWVIINFIPVMIFNHILCMFNFAMSIIELVVAVSVLCAD
jgi:hypothetical protein